MFANITGAFQPLFTGSYCREIARGVEVFDISGGGAAPSDGTIEKANNSALMQREGALGVAIMGQLNRNMRKMAMVRISDVFQVTFLLPRRRASLKVERRRMLTTLRIKNLALVTDLTIELRPGYNVITGETGAGKSILIGALNLILGERADRSLIRSGSDACAVEAIFDVCRLKAPLKRFLEENGLEPCEQDELVLKRTVTIAGANRQFVNGSPTTLSVLATIGEWLVDIHGPHEHQSLLHPARQMTILDAFGNLENLRESFGELVRRVAHLKRRKRHW